MNRQKKWMKLNNKIDKIGEIEIEKWTKLKEKNWTKLEEVDEIGKIK